VALNDPSVITYMPDHIMHATGTLRSASASLMQCQTDLVNINATLASVMSGKYHNSYQEMMLQIEKPLEHLAELVNTHGQLLDSITSNILALDAGLA
jgi:uncharacterized protein YukE